MNEFSVKTKRQAEFISIQTQVDKIVKNSGTQAGICVVYCPHTTAGITINENADPDVSRDIRMGLEKMVPLRDPDYQHMEGNSAAHIKSTLVGASVMVPIENGSLCLGTWQGIYFCEFDGPRSRKVWVQIIKS